MKRITLVFTFVFAIAAGTTAGAVVKAGAACSKAGATFTVSNKKYTCIKSGKRLLWDKGVLLKNNIEKNSPTTKINPNTQNPVFSSASEGEICGKLGDEVKLKIGKLVCKYAKNMDLKLVFENGTFLPVENISSPDRLELCRLKDLRTDPINQESIAFPITSNVLVNKGVMNWGIVPIDFSDSPGKGKPSEIYKIELQKIDEWIQWYSNGKLKINWILKDEWIRAPLESQNYNWLHPGTFFGTAVLDPEQLMNELAKIGEKNFDYSKLDAVHYLYPLSVTKIIDALTTYSSITNTKVKDKPLMNTANGYWLTNPDNEQLIWAWMLHEIGHPMGLTGHFPINPYQYGIMANQGGMGLGLNSWDSLILDWILESQVFCIDSKNVTNQNIKIVPAEREQVGIRSVMIKLTESKIIVVESHRSDKWSHNMPLQNNGVMAFLVDTTKNTDRRDENLEFRAHLDKTGKYLTVENVLARKFYEERYSTIMYVGDTISAEGIQIKFVSSGDNDTIQISKINQ